MSARTVRHDTVTAIADLLRVHPTLTGVEVLDGPDIGDPRDELVLVGAEIRGVNTGLRHLQAGRKQRRDEFEIVVLVRTVRPQTTARDAAERAETIVSALDDLLAEDPLLGSQVSGLRRAELTGWDGPDVIPTPEGMVAVAECRVTCLTHLT